MALKNIQKYITDIIKLKQKLSSTNVVFPSAEQVIGKLMLNDIIDEKKLKQLEEKEGGKTVVKKQNAQYSNEDDQEEKTDKKNKTGTSPIVDQWAEDWDDQNPKPAKEEEKKEYESYKVESVKSDSKDDENVHS